MSCEWLSLDESGVLLTTLVYQFINIVHSDVGALRVLFENFNIQPSTYKVEISRMFNELIEKSPLIDLIMKDIQRFPYLKICLSAISLYCSDQLLVFTSFTCCCKILEMDFEKQLFLEIIQLIIQFKVPYDWSNRIMFLHDNFCNKYSTRLKYTMKYRLEKNLEEMGGLLDHLYTKQSSQREKDEFMNMTNEMIKFNELNNEEQNKILYELIQRLQLYEKPIIFDKGNPIFVMSTQLIADLHKLLYLDENKLQWLANINTENEFLNEKLKNFIKRINFRYRWKDDELWFEWLKNQYVTNVRTRPNWTNSLTHHSELLSDMILQIEKEVNQQHVYLELNEKIPKIYDAKELQNEINNPKLFVHPKNIKQNFIMYHLNKLEYEKLKKQK